MYVQLVPDLVQEGRQQHMPFPNCVVRHCLAHVSLINQLSCCFSAETSKCLSKSISNRSSPSQQQTPPGWSHRERTMVDCMAATMNCPDPALLFWSFWMHLAQRMGIKQQCLWLVVFCSLSN